MLCVKGISITDVYIEKTIREKERIEFSVMS